MRQNKKCTEYSVRVIMKNDVNYICIADLTNAKENENKAVDINKNHDKKSLYD